MTTRRDFLTLGGVAALGALVGELVPLGSARAARGGESELDALLAELERGIAELRLPDAAEPYAAELRGVRAESLTIDGSYGGVIVDLRSSDAIGSVSVRVGSAERDNTNFFGGNIEPSFRLPQTPDPEAARKRLWLAMDNGFRASAVGYQAKLSAIDRLADTDLPADQGPAPEPVVDLSWAPDAKPGASLPDPPAVGPASAPSFDRAAMVELAGELSGRFRQHPTIDNGDVVIQQLRSVEFSLTSEGVARGAVVDRAVLGVVAQTQAPDGMELDHGLAIHVQHLPTAAELRERGQKLVDQVLTELEALVAAPMLDEDYDGPILLGPTAAAQLLASTVAVHATGEPAPLSDYGRLLELEPHWHEKLGSGVLPDELDLIDDPLADGFGHYVRDAEGFAAERLELVRAGKLHTLLMTRRPNDHIALSNGHARATAAGFMGPCISNLTLSSKRRGLSTDKLERELLRRAAEDGYEFAFVVDTLRDGSVLGSVPRDSAAVFTSGRKVTLPLPGRVYKIAPKSKGSRELVRTQVRGGMFSPMSMRVLRRIRAIGDAPQALPMRIPPGLSGGFGADLGLDGLLAQTVDVQVTTPALLIDGLELLVERGENERLPILDHPLRRE